MVLDDVQEKDNETDRPVRLTKDEPKEGGHVFENESMDIDGILLVAETPIGTLQVTEGPAVPPADNVATNQRSNGSDKGRDVDLQV